METNLLVGDIVECQITGIASYGIFVKIGEDINSIKYNEYYNDNSSINIGNTNYYKTTSQYPTITKYVKDFIE